MNEIESRFEPLPPQWAFFNSDARILGYGGAMGGGKSRCLCEWAFDNALRYPGIRILVCRQTHTSIIETTKKTMIEEVVPVQAIKNRKESAGEDYIRLWNGSQINFVGLDDPVRWFSSELGLLVFDEAHEILEETVVKLITRLRQRGMPHRVALGFNPENPGHWLFRWFMEANPTIWPDTADPRYAGKEKGRRKDKLFPKDSEGSLGSAEYIIAKARDNIFLPEHYIEQSLMSLPSLFKDRYLEGKWLYVSGMSFFDLEALDEYSHRIEPPWKTGRTTGDPRNKTQDDKPSIRTGQNGQWWIWKAPVRERDHAEKGKLPAHRYVVSVDVSSGTSNDYSAIQVLDVDDFAQVAEFQGRIDPDLLAVEAARIGWIYNRALIAPEVTGGWGHSVVRKLEDLRYTRVYTRRVEDRLAKKWTDVLGWDTNSASRAYMLDKLEEVIRERELKLRSPRTIQELASFVWPSDKKMGGPYKGIPQAQPGSNDDLVMALAIGVAVVLRQPKEIRKPTKVKREQVLVTGF